MGTDTECSGRWNHIKRLLERGGPFAHPDFEPSTDNLTFIQETCRILVIGAGGLGCELLKNLALLGFRDIHVIDMDTIDVSNLNRQFLFRPKDVGSSKADVAARFINTRVPGCKVTPHHAKIQDFDESFYRGFHIVVCGLDSIVARRWINGMLFSLLKYENGEVDQTSVIPLVDGGTEGLKGNARVILPGITACIECTLDLYPPQINFPLCTIAHTPRLPEHCIEYARILLWPKEEPFGVGVPIDGDNPLHISWIMKKAEERAEEHRITGITYRLTQGVVKRIIPAVASTNAVIADIGKKVMIEGILNHPKIVAEELLAEEQTGRRPSRSTVEQLFNCPACATEVFKLATSCCQPLNNYMNFNDIEGVYTYTFEAHKREDCFGCSLQPQTLSFCEEDKLQDVITYLTESTVYQMKSPGITTSIDGKNRTLYMQTVKSIEEKTRGNLKKTLKELGLTSGQELYIADVTTPSSLIFRLALSTSMDTSAENSLSAAN